MVRKNYTHTHTNTCVARAPVRGVGAARHQQEGQEGPEDLYLPTGPQRRDQAAMGIGVGAAVVTDAIRRVSTPGFFTD